MMLNTDSMLIKLMINMDSNDKTLNICTILSGVHFCCVAHDAINRYLREFFRVHIYNENKFLRNPRQISLVAV